jgi:hypothetical protein
MHRSSKKSVRFCTLIGFCEIEIIKRDSEYDLWWTIDELRSFKRRDRQTVRLMNYIDPAAIPDNSIHCTRGLEYKTFEFSNRRKFNRIQAHLSVLDEQEFQWDENIHDEELIAALYKKMCKSSQEEAHSMALKDQIYVKDNVRTDGRALSYDNSSKTKAGAEDLLDAASDDRQPYIYCLNSSKPNGIQQRRVAGSAA